MTHYNQQHYSNMLLFKAISHCNELNLRNVTKYHNKLRALVE